MSTKKCFLPLFLCLCQIIFAQQVPIVLDKVVVADYQLKNFTNSKLKQVLNDSIIARNQASLTSLLNFNSVIYFKENGLGMVASPSFRGSTAQQTAVIWNGININSQLNGQTDFNLISSNNFDNITIQSGGSSAIYGSSAIGGSIHLNNDLKFNQLFNNDLQIKFGSFNTLGVNYKTAVANDKMSAQISVSRNSSRNDYPFLKYPDLKNENGQFSNFSINAGFAYKFNQRNILKFYSQFFDSERYLSPSIGAISKAKYQDFNTRNLVEFSHLSNNWSQTVKFAFLSERYKYYSNYSSINFDSSTAESLIAKYDVNYKLSKKSEFNAILDFTKTKGYGSSIGENSRNIGAATLLFKTFLSKFILLESSIRKENTNNYDSPFLYAVGSKINFTKNYNLKFNISKNFRIPSFNDLFWTGLGNKNLLPETSNSGEICQELVFNKLKLSATTYFSKTNNLIQWTPVNNIWTPKNVANSRNYGVEVYAKINQNIRENKFSITSSYAYTRAIDESTNTNLIYVPKHKINSEFGYVYKKVSLHVQYLFNGSVFTSQDNSLYLKEFRLTNCMADYSFGNKKTINLGFQILNIFNLYYQNVQGRPMPGRNFNININFKL